MAKPILIASFSLDPIQAQHPLEEDQTGPVASFPLESGLVASFPLDGQGSPLPAKLSPESPSTGAWAQAGLGALEALVPFSLGKKELVEEAPQGGAETTARLVGRIGTDLATTALAGVAAGALAGGVGAPVGLAAGLAIGALGVYRALGTEAMHTEATGEAPSVGRTALNLVVEANPWFPYGRKLVAAATQAVFQAGQAVAYGAGAEGALLAGAVGGAGGALATKARLTRKAFQAEAEVVAADLGASETSAKILVSQAEHLVPAVTKKIQADPQQYSYVSTGDFSPEASYTPAELTHAARRVTTDDLEKAVAYFKEPEGDLVQQAAKLRLDDEKLAKALWLTKGQPTFGLAKEDILALAQKKANAQGLTPEDLDEVWLTRQAWGEAISERTTELSRSISKSKDPTNSYWWKQFGDLRYVMADMEQKSQIPLVSAMQDVVNSHNVMQTELLAVLSRTAKLRSSIEAEKLDPKLVTKYLETEGVTVPAKYQAAVDSYRAEFKTLHDYAKDRWGVVIDWRDWYAPHRLAGPAEQFKQVSEAARGLTSQQILDGAVKETPGLGELTGALQYTLGRSLKTTEDVELAMNLLRTGQSAQQKTSKGFQASAAFAREKYMPSLLREQDINVLHLKYASNLLNAGTLSKPLLTLADRADLYAAAGWEGSANYIRRYVDDLSNKPSGYASLTEAAKVRWKNRFQEFINKAGGEEQAGLSLKLGQDVPELLSFMSSQIYPAFMGFRLAPVLRNLTAIPLMVGTELGGSGTAAVLRGVAKFYKNPKLYFKEMEASGLRTAEQTFEAKTAYEQALSEALPKGLRAVLPTVRKINQLGMSMFQLTDKLNRGMTTAIADELAEAYASKAPWALRWAKTRLPKAYHEELKLTSGEDQQIMFRNYLVPKTQFDYGKAGMNQFGREFGSWAMMFSKWPTSIASDAVWQVKKAGLAAGAGSITAKMLAPLALLYWLGNISEWDKSPRLQAALGRKLESVAPVNALANIGSHPYLEIAKAGGKIGLAGVEGLARVAAGDWKQVKARQFIRPLGDLTAPATPVVYGALKGYQQAKQLITGRKETP